MKYVIAILISIILAGTGGLGCYISNLRTDLGAEQLAHRETKTKLAREMARAEALADNARRCLAREALAQACAAERNAILANAAEEERTPEEKEKVADHATRNAVIERLNRGLRH